MMMRPGLSCASSALAALLAVAAARAATEPGTWTTYRNEKYGFSLAVPDIFVSGSPRNATNGWLWLSRDRQARLLAAASKNETEETLESYRQFLMRGYASASFADGPVHDTWFVLSGTKGNRMFYEHITFACDGQYIYGWQLMYPASARHLYEGIIEKMQKSFQPGRGTDGNCG